MTQEKSKGQTEKRDEDSNTWAMNVLTMYRTTMQKYTIDYCTQAECTFGAHIHTSACFITRPPCTCKSLATAPRPNGGICKEGHHSLSTISFENANILADDASDDDGIARSPSPLSLTPPPSRILLPSSLLFDWLHRAAGGVGSSPSAFVITILIHA